MPIYFVSHKILLEAAQLQNHFIVYTFLLYLYSTRVVRQTKWELVACITRVSVMFTDNHVHAKHCMQQCMCMPISLIFICNKHAGTHMY